MSDGLNNELISAMFDGEVSPEQRAEVDAHLADSGTAKTEMAQLEALSKLVSGIPSEAAPPQLAQGVMAKIVSNAPESAQSTSTQPVSVSTPFWKRHWGGIAAMATAAAAMFLMFRGFAGSNSQPSVVARSDAAMGTESFVVESEMASSGAPSDDMESLRPQTAAQVEQRSELFKITENSGVSVIRVAPDAEELFKRYLRAEMLAHEYAPTNAVLKENDLDAIVVEASREDIQALLAHVEEESGPGSLQPNRDTDPNSLTQRLLASLALAPPEMTIAGNVARKLPPTPSVMGGGGGTGRGGAGFGGGSAFEGAESAIEGSRGGMQARKARSMPAAPSAPSVAMRSRATTPKDKKPESVGENEAQISALDATDMKQDVEQSLQPPAIAKAAPKKQKKIASAVQEAFPGPGAAAAASPTAALPMRVIFVVRKPQTDSNTDPCIDAA